MLGSAEETFALRSGDRLHRDSSVPWTGDVFFHGSLLAESCNCVSDDLLAAFAVFPVSDPRKDKAGRL